MLECMLCLVVEKGVDITTKDRKGNAVPCMAALAGNVEVLRYFLTEGMVDVDSRNYQADGYTLLTIAASENHLNVVKMLVEKGADVCGRSSEYGLTQCRSRAREFRRCPIFARAGSARGRP